MTSETLRVGELAKRTGLTVRTLHHYDALGLVRPSRRTAAGHRLYAASDVSRLYVVRALRLLGLSLEEIHAVLERRGVSLRSALELQLRAVERRIELELDLRERLRGLLRHLAVRKNPSVAALMETMERMTNMLNHFTPEQQETLRRRAAELGEDEIRAVEAEWPVLIAKVRAEMERGTDPTDPRVAPLARRWSELVRAFTGGDAGISRAVGEVYKQEGESLRREHGDAVPTPEMFSYISRAMAALRS